MKKIFYAIVLPFLMAFHSCTGNDITSMQNAEFAAAISNTSSVILIDVRTAEEFAQGHIPGAINIDVKANDFKDRITSLDKRKTAAVYCRSGVRSMTAARILAGAGFRVYNLQNGILGWNGTTEK